MQRYKLDSFALFSIKEPYLQASHRQHADSAVLNNELLEEFDRVKQTARKFNKHKSANTVCWNNVSIASSISKFVARQSALECYRVSLPLRAKPHRKSTLRETIAFGIDHLTICSPGPILVHPDTIRKLFRTQRNLMTGTGFLI